MRILGIDPSLTGTGLVIIDGDDILKQELVKTSPTKTMVEELERLLTITNKAIDLSRDVDLVIMEDLAVGVSKTSALTQLAGLNYLIRYKLLKNKTPLLLIKPTTTKKFICKGNAKKQEMLLEVYKKFGESFHDDNLCDAYAMAKIAQQVADNVEGVNEKEQDVLKLLKPQYEEIMRVIKNININ